MNEMKKTPIGALPLDWEIVKTKHLFKNKSFKNYPNEPVLSVTQDAGVIFRDTIERRISMDNSKTKNFKLVEKGNFIISLRSFQGGIEKSNIQGLVSPAYTVLEPSKEVVSDFYKYYFKFSNFISYLGKAVIGIRDGKQISYSVFSDLLVPLPPIKEQQKIAAILSSVDDAIAKTEQIIEQTERVKQGLMQQLLTRGIGHTEFKQTKMGEIPKDWRLTELGAIADVRDGTHESPKYYSEGIPLITSKNLKPYGLDFSNVNYISETDHQKISRRSKVEHGDILFGMIGTIGNPIIVNHTREFSIKNVALIKFDQAKISNYFIYYILNSGLIRKQFNQTSNGGVQKFIALGTIRKTLIPMPSYEEQKKIVALLTEVDSKISIEKSKNTKLHLLKKGLMQQLLTGKVRVPVDENEVISQ